MEQEYFSKRKKKYKHLSEYERYKIEALLESRKSVKEIASILKRDVTTIYREIERGQTSRLQTDLTEKRQYRADVAQAGYQRRTRNRERPLKIGHDRRLEEYIRVRLKEDRFSPDAIIGEIKVLGLKFERIICTKTLYNYIEKGIFSGVSNKDLWEKRKKKKRKYRPIVRLTRKNRLGKIIDQRPRKVNKRLEYGHWEGDCIVGPQKTKASLLTLTERKAREQVIIKLKRTTQEAVKKALDRIENEYGPAFKAKFKTITFDNGMEFLNWESLELSAINTGKRRTSVYFAHAYSAWERGSNENQNRMIRRFIPKGSDIAEVSEEEIKRIEHWMNNYPRRILGYKTANEVSKEHFQNKGNIDLELENVAI